MGPNVDGETGTLQNPAANSDDVNNALPDDEDGLNNPVADLLLTVGAQPTINVLVTNTTGTAATLFGWIDYNSNGIFDNTTERASIAVPNGTNNSIVTLVLPAVPSSFTGETYARFRLSTHAAAANPTAAAADGEVEDYRVTIVRPTDASVDSSKTKLLASGTHGMPIFPPGDNFAHSVATIGDLDGDGIADLAVGAIGNDIGSSNAPNQGALYILFMNADGTVRGSQKIAGNVGGGPSLNTLDSFGRTVTSLGDLDGDGVTDLAVGTANFNGQFPGGVYVLFMNTNGTVKSHQLISSGVGGGPILVSRQFGYSVASLGDLDGDGVSDIATGAIADSVYRGAVYVLFMNANGTAKSFQKIAAGIGGGPTLAPDDTFGRTLASLGDIDGDGVTDLAVGAQGDDTGGAFTGAVYVLLLNSNGTVKSSQKIAAGAAGAPPLELGDGFGGSLASLGDLDGDGVTDLGVGATQDHAVHLLHLNANGTVKGYHKIARGTGHAVSSLGDLDGDGFTDLAVGRNPDALYELFLSSAPVFTSPTSASVAENSTAVMTVTATDVDVPPQTLTFSIVGGADQAKFSITPAGVLSFVAPPNFEVPTDANGDNVYVVSVQADDGNGGIATQSISVTVTPVNDNAPVITSPNAASVSENTAAVMTVTATDADLPPQTITFSLAASGDHAAFNITPGGELSFKSPPDFEAPTDAGGDNVYNIVVQASDGGLTTTQAVAVTVTPLNDHVLAFISPPEFSVVQGSIPVGMVIAVDRDVPGAAVTYEIVGGADQSKLIITSGGFLTFLSPPSFSMPADANGDNIYVIEVRATGAGQIILQTVQVMVIAAPLDYGDAPDTAPGNSAGNYRTLATDNGPRHFIRGGLRLGAVIDGDSGTLQNSAATADDVNGALPDDEDGLVNPANDLWVTSGTSPTVAVRVTNMTGMSATLWGWIDYNANGVFDNASERASIAVPTGTNNGLVTLAFPAVLGSFTGDSFARFRISTDADASDPTGEVVDGEVEDYPVTITRPSSGTADPVRSLKIASGTNGGPALANGDMFGAAVASIGDLDGDGVPDLAVGAPVQFGAASGGKIYVLFMNANGTVKSSQEIGSGIGGGPSLMLGDYFGHSIASIGDLDGDGIGDIAVGADKDDTLGYNRGAVHVLRMNASGTVKASTKIAHNTLGGPLLANGDRFGSSVASLGDLDGDGVAELAVGATGEGAYNGAVHVLFMRADGTVKTLQKIASGTSGGPVLADFDEFGIGMATLGDLDGDAVTELAVGAFRDDTGGAGRGAVYVLSMNSNGTVKSSTKIASGTGGGPVLADGDYFGRSVGSLGDLDGDGVADLAVGAYRDDTGGGSRGAVHVLFLNANGTVKRSEKIAHAIGGGPTLANDDRFGSGVAAIGDLDGDGVIELAGAAEADRTGGLLRGAVHVLFLNPANANPVFTSPSAVSVPENATAVLTVTASDADFPPQTVTFSIVGGADQAKFALTPAGVLSFVVAPDFEVPTDANADNVYVVTVQASDSNGGTAMQTISVTVTPVNDNAPVITSPTNVNVAENTTAVMTVSATDADQPPQTLTFTIVGGADQSKFAITPAGALTFVAAPDFEMPTDANGDNVYVVIVQASDGTMTSVQAILVAVTPVNDNSPVITSPANVNVPENITAITTVTATDADLPAQAITFSIVGGADQALFAITSGGALSFVAPRDFEMPTDADANGIYVVTVEASDGNGRTTTQTLNVTVSPVNDNAPVITSPDSASVPENTTNVLTVTATDADLPPQTVTFSIVGGSDQSQFAITPGGALSFISPPDFENPADSNGDNVYVVIVQASDGGLTSLQAILVSVTNVVGQPVNGDYNGNGVVDAADYALWRNGGPLQNDSTPGVQPADYDVWRANFGRSAESAASAAVAALADGVAGQRSASVPGHVAESSSEAERTAFSTSPTVLANVASPPATRHRLDRNERLLSGESHDSALVAWLVSRSAGIDEEVSLAFDGATNTDDMDVLSDDLVDAVDLAFATL
jgi:hypothetical protein